MAEQKNQKEIRALPEVLNVQNVFTILEEELNTFQEIAQQFRGETAVTKFMRQAKNVLQKKSLAEGDIFGEGIALSFPTVKIKESVKRLKMSPLDSKARLDLVEPFAMKGIKGSLLVYRQAILHAMFELTSFHITSEKLNIALMAQRRYLDKLASYFGEEMASCQSIINDIQSKSARKNQGDDSKAQTKTKEEILQDLKNFKQKQDYVKEMSDLLKGKQINQPLEIDIADLRSSGALPKDVVLKTVVPLLGSMVALPIVHPNTRNLIEIVKAGAPSLPAGGFYEARMHRLHSKILFAGYVAGWQELAVACQKSILATYNAINATMSIVGNNPSTKLEKACVREFGMVCLLVFQQMPMLGSAPPKELISGMSRAVGLLEGISDEPGVFELITVLRKNLSP